MDAGQTTIAVERYLGELARLDGNAPADPIIRALIATSVTRLHLLCRALLLKSYPRLTRPWLYHLLPQTLGCDGWYTARVTTCGEVDAAVGKAQT